jgi:hypothetical protein
MLKLLLRISATMHFMKEFEKHVESLNEVGKLVHEYRVTHDGYAPKEIFEPIFPIVGQYESFGAIVRKGECFGFVQRTGEMGEHWVSKYQLPCMTVKPNDNDTTLLERLAESELGVSKEAWAALSPSITMIPGRTVHWEGERTARCRTRRCFIEIDDTSILGGTWRFVSEEELRAYVNEYDGENASSYDLIDHMVGACLWFLDPERIAKPERDIDLRTYISAMHDPYPFIT